MDVGAAGFAASTSLATRFLALAPDALAAGYAYRFRLDASDANGAAAAFLTLRRNAPPAGGSLAAVLPFAAHAEDEKQRRLPAAKLAELVRADIEQNQFLVTGKLTRSLYDESCTFKDEIDTYTLDKWIKGTGALFVASLSHVDLVGDVVADEKEVSFRFTETLAFNLPLVKPKVAI